MNLDAVPGALPMNRASPSARIDQGIAQVEEWVSLLALGAIIVLVTAQVFMRYVLDSGLIWSDEVVTILMVAMVLFGVPAVVRLGMQTELVVFVDKLPPVPRRVVRVTTHCVGLAFILLFLYASLVYTMNTGTMVTTVLRIPVRYVYVLLPLGAALLLYEYAKTLVTAFRNRHRSAA